METTGLIILAAGNSSRLGQPKQLLEYNGQTLIKHAIDTALQVISTPVIVVLGADEQLVKHQASGYSVHVVNNNDWKEGLASSIRCGVDAILKISPDIDNVILMVCDQPFVTASLIKDLIDKRSETQKGIIACAYKETLGTPVLFKKKYYDELLDLKGSEGAKKLVSKYLEDVSPVSFPKGFIDVDTVEEYEKLINNSFRELE
jgi:molybdenum cofactor cytidylyltransferase